MCAMFSTQQNKPLLKVWRSAVLCSWPFLDLYHTATGFKRNTWPGAAAAAQGSVMLLIPTLYQTLLSAFLYTRGSYRRGERITSVLRRRERQCFCEKKSETCWVPGKKECPASGQKRDQSCTSKAGGGEAQETLELPEEVHSSLLVFSFRALQILAFFRLIPHLESRSVSRFQSRSFSQVLQCWTERGLNAGQLCHVWGCWIRTAA